MAANDKFKEEDPEIINLFKQLEKEKEEINDKTSDFTNIKTIIDTLKKKYIEKIITFKIGYEKKDLEKNSITKLQDIYINFNEYNEYNDGNDKCKNISFVSGANDKNIESSLLILLVALFNKKNYILTKLFDEQYYNKNTSEAINNIIKNLHDGIKSYKINISQKEPTFPDIENFLLLDNIYQYCKLLLNTQYKTSEDMRYLTELQININNKDETNFYNLLYLIQDKLMKFPKNICDTNNITNKYNNKIFYNVSYNTNELNIKDLNTDDKLKLNVLLENNKTEEVIIKKIPLIFININKKHKADNPIKIFLNTIYQLYEDFIKLFDTIDIATINNIKLLLNIDNIIKYIKYLSKIFITNDKDSRVSLKQSFNTSYEQKIQIAADNISAEKNDTLINPFATYFFDLLKKMKLLLDDFDNRIICLYLIHEYLNSLNNENLFKNIVSNTISDTDEEYKNLDYIDNLNTFFGQLKTDNEEFKKYIDDVEKIIENDISDGLNSFNQFTNDELEKLNLDIKPEKVSFGQTLEIGDNVLYLNSIVIKHKMTNKYNDYIYICIYECNGKWYMYDCKRKYSVVLIGNDFNEMYKWRGFKIVKYFDTTNTEEAVEADYVQKNVVGLFYT